MKRIIVLILLISRFAVGQEFTGGAQLPQPFHDGFYRIQITSEMTGFLEPDCSNARIIDESGAEVPYIFEEDSKKTLTFFREYKLIERTHHANCCTSIIIENDSSHILDNLLLRVRNAEVGKTASLMGSDDRRQWFALKENFTLSNFDAGAETSEVRVLNFPSSDYRYFWLKINDSTSPPLNVQQVGFVDDTAFDPSYTSVTPQATAEKDSAKTKQTFYSILFSGNVWIDRIEITAGGAPYFYRKGILYEALSERNNKGALIESLEHVASFDISSEGPTRLEIPGSRGKKFVVAIENDDNPPLNIESLKAYQLSRYLTTYLKAASTYSLRWGPDLTRPVYDLNHFKDVIPANAEVIQPGLLMLQGDKTDQQVTATLLKSPALIWSAIIMIILLLGWMSLSMIRDARARRDAP